MRGGRLLLADVPGDTQHAVAVAAFLVAVEKISVVSGIALTRTVRWKEDRSELLEVQL